MQTAIDVLVIDGSDRDARTTLSGIRRGSEAATVLRFKLGEEALHYVLRTGSFADRASLDPRMIFLEMDLPALGGLEVLDRLQGTPATRPIPVVALSSNMSAFTIEDALNRGAREYLIKPPGKGAYISEVARAVSRWAPMIK